MEHSITRPSGSGLDQAVAFARREPGRLLAWVLGLHLLAWTLLPILVCHNLQLDLLEALALGKEWQFGYWKHPPLPWWTTEIAFQAIGDVRAVYLLGPLASVLAMYAVWRLGRDTVGPANALIAVLLLEGIHFFNFTAVKFNNDVMQLPFWALTGLSLYRAITRKQNRDWILCGIWLALAFWTKYAAIVLAGSIGLFLLADPFARRAWRTPGPYLMAAAFLLMIAPHLAWLVEHDFLPFHYADERARVAAHWYEFVWFPLRWISSQALFLAPTIVLLALLLERRSNPAGDEDKAFWHRYVAMLAFGPFVLTTVAAGLLGRLPVAMWGYPMWTFAPLAAVTWFAPTADPRRLRLFAGAFLFVFAAMPLCYAGVELLEPFVRDRPKATQFPGKLLAETVTRVWREQTGMPLAYVGGAEFNSSGAGEFSANNVAVYSSDHPHVVAHGDLQLSPWIDVADLKRRGIVLVWEGSSSFEETHPNLRTILSNVETQPPLTLPRQTLYPRKPAVVQFAIVRPQP